MKVTSPLVSVGLLMATFVPAASVAHANGTPSMDWTFTNGGSTTPCATTTSPPSFAYGGYGSGQEAPVGCNADDWSAHGEGYFFSPVGGEVNMCVSADDFIDVTINDEILLNNVGGDGCARINLREGRCYEIVIDFIEVGGYANFAVSWDVSGSQVTMATEDFVQGPCPYVPRRDLSDFPSGVPSPDAEALPSTL